MKGDGNININIKFLNVGYNNFYQVNLRIIDENNNIIFEGKTYNGMINICLIPYKKYKMIANFFNERLEQYFYVCNNNYIFSFNNSINKNYNSRTITFLLNDYYYNLPIEKGEILLWQNQ